MFYIYCKNNNQEGYSGTPFAKKLGIKSRFKIVLVNQPKQYKSLFVDFPEDVLEVSEPKSESVDFIHIFCTALKDLKIQIVKQKPYLNKDGLIWVRWSKETSKMATDLNRDLIRDYILSEIKLVDVKVAAIDTDWSGLKFVCRKEDRN
ncbi:DUF3052 domain-containing protein [Aestuariivivens marinum]|uniref:DUF3052 domain-containing protein n=1 Tax=Aestuariivivens marinum TaxID=2913555 RepID=UPI001F57908D|nr:DUF3052 domain-containing protein [Aestuariivivens marinum]